MDYFPPIGIAHCILHLTMNQLFSTVMSETYILLQKRHCKRENLVGFWTSIRQVEHMTEDCLVPRIISEYDQIERKDQVPSENPCFT